jgi:hypothetical protein
MRETFPPLFYINPYVRDKLLNLQFMAIKLISEDGIEPSRLAPVNFKFTLSTYFSTRIKAKAIRTPIKTIMSSLLYQLSYGLVCGRKICTFKYRTWAWYVTITSIHKLIAQEGLEPSFQHWKSRVLSSSTIGPKALCKYRTYLYRLQNGHITFMLTGRNLNVKLIF